MKPRVSGTDFQDGVECKSVDAVKQTVVLPEKDIPGAKLQLRNFCGAAFTHSSQEARALSSRPFPRQRENIFFFFHHLAN